MESIKAYLNKADLLRRKYDRFVDEFKQYHDDRILMVNMMKQLMNSCKVMEGIENAFICAAFNKAFHKQDKEMEEIVTRFTGLVWEEIKWVEGELDKDGGMV